MSKPEYQVNLHALSKTAKSHGLELAFDEKGIAVHVMGRPVRRNLSLRQVINVVLNPIHKSGGRHETEGKNVEKNS